MTALPEDLDLKRTMIANVVMIGKPGSGHWVLVDCGIAGFSRSIQDAAEERFGSAPPKSIVLTHGHFDHVGSLEKLLEEWDVPVYAHELELPYVRGTQDYPEPDPAAGGGLMTAVSPLYPRHGLGLGGRVQPLPSDGHVPHLPEWRWIHTPGHTPGHISLFRERDRTVIAGDAFITVKQESAWAVLTQEQEVHGPPVYFTPDWHASKLSVRRLRELDPALALTGHGVPMDGEALRKGLSTLAESFDEIAVPSHGRYAGDRHAAEDKRPFV
ncbi:MULTISPECIES: MBL fold metallo-hydrolase [unclassified Paenibacillus]|uniref:MBL fold metallo-hydrolase n=1 Tax=unclassified Paenibacillus TaxID=185978 RepID=UPI000954DD54|nr:MULTISPECIES: MBL fold metallo-hydrolase [unclassified Paenibacillus]SIQ34066.1 Glyoxylase, beta-lactamase superfamily II [Paenibacillus sp. RU4X]SIQ55774.1 Glyoxylase, beta-lactamase superfamily II [Paenibacillus sp. RU4T]